MKPAYPKALMSTRSNKLTKNNFLLGSILTCITFPDRTLLGKDKAPPKNVGGKATKVI